MAQHPSVKLLLRERQRRDHAKDLARPYKAALIQAPGGVPDAEAVVHQQLDARGAHVGKKVAAMGLGGAEDLNHAGQQALGLGADVRA